MGYSYNSRYYGLDGIDEAKAYLAHPVLGSRLREITSALLLHVGSRNIRQLMGSSIDLVKLKSCMTLFDEVSPNDVFADVLAAFYGRRQ